ncbi:MAG: hypothetical protein E7299_00475 [Lachnospiraceae bacterium]|nr:hypothetical protein [Lachnospiraceae bacterium]
MKKLIATSLAIVMALTVFIAPANQMKAEARPLNEGKVYSVNSDREHFARVSISTPETTTRLYAGLTWEQLSKNIGVRLTIDEPICGPAALAAFDSIAKSFGGSVVRVVDADLEAYLNSWCRDITSTYSPIRVALEFADGWDTTKDYAILSLKEDGSMEILGDIDANPSSVTVDASYFDTFAIISAPQGTFNAYRVASPVALATLPKPAYCKKIPSTISTSSLCSSLYDIATITDAATVKGAVGDSKPKLVIKDARPGKLARAAMDLAIAQVEAKKVTYYQVDMLKRDGTNVEQTAQKIRITMTVPYTFPAYADYAVAVVNENGSATILRDLDIDAHTITIDTDDFRAFAIIAGKDGAFDALPLVY